MRVNPRADSERVKAAQLDPQLTDVLARRERLGRVREELEQTGDHAALSTGREIALINEVEIPSQKRVIVDATNAAKDSRARTDLRRLLKRLGSAMSGLYTEREVDISPEREILLESRLAAAKTNSARREVSNELEQLRRNRALLEARRDEFAKRHADRRRVRSERAKNKKIERMFRKLDRTEPQEGT